MKSSFTRTQLTDLCTLDMKCKVVFKKLLIGVGWAKKEGEEEVGERRSEVLGRGSSQ